MCAFALQDTRAHQLNVDDDTDSSESYYSELEDEEDYEEEGEVGDVEDYRSTAFSYLESGRLPKSEDI